MRIPVINGTSRVHSEILKVSARPSVYWLMCKDPLLLRVKPQIRNITNVINIDGMVVNIMYRMWSKMSTLADDEARIVVSLNGDILSPK